MSSSIVHTLYQAFQRRDGTAMAACYHPEASFEDPVFRLQGNEVGAMWRMLCDGARDLEVTYRDVQATDAAGSALWEARYTFSVTGRKVHNVVDATFTFRDGKIATHRDRFGFWRWSRMALGAPGMLLGWTPLVRGSVQRRARRNLTKFISRT